MEAENGEKVQGGASRAHRCVLTTASLLTLLTLNLCLLTIITM